MPEVSREELEELAEKAAAHASALTGQHISKEVGKQVGERMEEAMGHHSPISPRCEDILGTPTPVYDFRGSRAVVMCLSWMLMEKEERTKLPVGEAWRILRQIAPTTKPTTPEEKEEAMKKWCDYPHAEQIEACKPYVAKKEEKAPAGV